MLLLLECLYASSLLSEDAVTWIKWKMNLSIGTLCQVEMDSRA